MTAVDPRRLASSAPKSGMQRKRVFAAEHRSHGVVPVPDI